MVTIVDEKNLGFALGAADYLTKPIEREKLIAALARYRDGPAPARALIIEDDPNTLSMETQILEKAGWTVSGASNGRAGLEEVSRGVPNVILLDLMMPEMDGFEFLRELRQMPAGRTVPVIVLTGKDLTEEEQRMLRDQVKTVVQKGTRTADDLVHEIRQVLAGGAAPGR
jgi:CheY-like chemotaxis protein